MRPKPTITTELTAVAERLRIIAALATDFEQYTLLPEVNERKEFTIDQIEHAIERLAALNKRALQTYKNPTQQEEPTCPENATASKSPTALGKEEEPELFR
jgi:hypothetical protein